MKTDSIFYQLFQTSPNIFFELIGQSNVEVSAYEFKSVEIKQTAFRIDGVFLPTVDLPEPLIYFAEVQFQPDTNFYYRFITEIFLFLGQNKPKKDWRAVAVFPQRSIDSELPIEYQSLLSKHIQQVYLNELDTTQQSVELGLIQLIIEPEATAGEKVRQLIEQAKLELENELIREEIVKLIKTIMFYKFPNLSRQELEAMFGVGEFKQTKVYQEAKEEGREEGRQEGKLEAKLESIPRLLAMGLSVEQVAQALGLAVEVVQQQIQG
ncbi:MAG: Rpn family recombination-promoting nuclease/putative transposase [Coleofasciculaceae cyanobacterium]